jgi:1-acyl-sn-glycerol-3-phosphate acyltransferase
LHIKLFGWTCVGEPPTDKKYMMVSGPHTSNWDFYILLMYLFKYRIPIHWLGKSNLFKGPFAPLVRWMGGIPVDRSKSNNLAQQVIDFYNDADELIVLITPEGTRSKVDKWKTGFYHIAHGANIPINSGYVDFEIKELGWGPRWVPTGEVEKEIGEIRAFFATKSGKYPELGPDRFGTDRVPFVAAGASRLCNTKG